MTILPEHLVCQFSERNTRVYRVLFVIFSFNEDDNVQVESNPRSMEIHSSVFCVLSSVFCLLSFVFCLLSSVFCSCSCSAHRYIIPRVHGTLKYVSTTSVQCKYTCTLVCLYVSADGLVHLCSVRVYSCLLGWSAHV